MKKFLVFSLMLGAMMFSIPEVEAKGTGAAVSAEPQIRVQTRRYGRYNRGARHYTRTRTIRVGRRLYRETYRITYLPNGRTRTRIISRVRIR